MQIKGVWDAYARSDTFDAKARRIQGDNTNVIASIQMETKIEWVPVGGGFIEADVIRWKESVYERRGRRRRSYRVGERLVVAEVLKAADKDGWVQLLIRHCEVVSEVWGHTVRTMPPVGSTTRRKFNTIVRGKAERLLWSDENARAVIASKFIGV